MRTPAAVLLAVILSGIGSPRRASADEAAYRHHVDQATRVLREAEAYQGAGREALARDRARRAAALLAQADRLKPGDPNVAFLAVQAAVFAEDAASARLWIARYAQRTPYGEEDPGLHHARALVWLRLDHRPARAVQALDRMAAVSPRGLARPANVLLYEALTALAAGLVDAGHADDAVARFRRASQVARQLGDAQREIAARANGALALLEFGRPADAEKLLARLHAQQPANPVFATWLGRCLRAQARFAEAATVLEEAAAALDAGRVAPRHVDLVSEAWLELGRVRRALADREDDAVRRTDALQAARRAFERFTTLVPRAAGGWHRLGRLLAEDLDLPLEAIDPLERAHGLDPACDGALRLLIRIAGGHGPPAGETEAAWRTRRAAWEARLEANTDRWKADRERRRATSRDGSDGCP